MWGLLLEKRDYEPLSWQWHGWHLWVVRWVLFARERVFGDVFW